MGKAQETQGKRQRENEVLKLQIFSIMDNGPN